MLISKGTPIVGAAHNKVPEDSLLAAGKARRSKRRPKPVAQALKEGSSEEEEAGDGEPEEDEMEEDPKELPTPDALDDDTRKSLDAFLAAADDADVFSRPSSALAGLTRLATKVCFQFNPPVKFQSVVLVAFAATASFLWAFFFFPWSTLRPSSALYSSVSMYG